MLVPPPSRATLRALCSSVTPTRVSVLVLLLAVWLALSNNPLDPTLWTTPFPLPSLERNSLLANAARFERKVAIAPESLAMDPLTGLVYCSLGDGRVVSLTERGRYSSLVFFTGDHVPSSLSERVSKDRDEVLQWCMREARMGRLAWDKAKERICGRPLGLRLRRVRGATLLYVLDAYHGLFSIDMSDRSRTVRHLISASTSITLPQRLNRSPSNSNSNSSNSSSYDEALSLPPRFFNDLDVSSDGAVYFTDSSYKHTRSQNRQELLDAAPRGRLFSFWPREHGGDGQLRPLLCGLHFPNGVQLSADAKSLLVVESARFRVLQLQLSQLPRASAVLTASCAENGPLFQHLDNATAPASIPPGAVSVFIDRIPGFPDNIRADSKRNGFYFIGCGTKSSLPFSLLWTAYQSRTLRLIVGKLVPMRFIEHLVPRYGMVVHSDGGAASMTVLQDPRGRVALVSEAQRHPISGDLWMGSHSNKFVSILPAGDMSI